MPRRALLAVARGDTYAKTRWSPTCAVADALTSAGTKTNDRAIASHLNHLTEAFAFYWLRRYDIRGKRHLSSGDKYYLADHAFRYAKLGTRNMDFGRVLENVVAIELLRRGYETYAGVLYKREVDFVAIRDAYPKMILARTRHEAYTYEGIEVHDLARWLSREG